MEMHWKKMPQSSMLFKYHQPKHGQDHGRIFMCGVAENQRWLEGAEGDTAYENDTN